MMTRFFDVSNFLVTFNPATAFSNVGRNLVSGEDANMDEASSSQLAAMMLRPGGLSQQSISTLRHTMRAFERTSAELQVRVFLGGSKKVWKVGVAGL